MGYRGGERQYLSKRMVGGEAGLAEFAGFCVRDDIVAGLIMDPHYKILILLEVT